MARSTRKTRRRRQRRRRNPKKTRRVQRGGDDDGFDSDLTVVAGTPNRDNDIDGVTTLMSKEKWDESRV